MEILLFFVTAIVIAVTGSFCTKLADKLATQSGVGQALMGGIFLGASTSLSGTVTSIISASHGHVDLSVSNALGGIALQTVFLCIADIAYKSSNLEHASASSTNIMMGILLIFLLTLPLLAQNFSKVTYFAIHPLTVVIFTCYFFGLKYINEQKKHKMWFPKKTAETIEDKPIGNKNTQGLFSMWSLFITLSLFLGLLGLAVEKIGIDLSQNLGFSHYLLGSIFTALATSLPELVVTLTAIRSNAITLAVAGIIGGNTYDVLFLGFADIAYRQGSIYHMMTQNHTALIAINIAMTSVLLLGLLRREKFGPKNIGIETWVMIAIFICGTVSILW